MDKKNKKNRLERIHHIVWIIAGLILIFFLIVGTRLVLDAQKYFP